MDANFNLRQHEHLKTPDVADPTGSIAHPRHLREEALDEIIRFVIIIGYLWVVFALLSIHNSIIISDYHLDFPEYFYAIVNFLVFTKVLRSCKYLHLGT